MAAKEFAVFGIRSYFLYFDIFWVYISKFGTYARVARNRVFSKILGCDA
jgi:hypothetical protein